VWFDALVATSGADLPGAGAQVEDSEEPAAAELGCVCIALLTGCAPKSLIGNFFLSGCVWAVY
jgi:hypothetical protein